MSEDAVKQELAQISERLSLIEQYLFVVIGSAFAGGRLASLAALVALMHAGGRTIDAAAWKSLIDSAESDFAEQAQALARRAREAGSELNAELRQLHTLKDLLSKLPAES